MRLRGDRDVFQTDVFQTGHFLDRQISDRHFSDETDFRHIIKTGHILDSENGSFPELKIKHKEIKIVIIII